MNSTNHTFLISSDHLDAVENRMIGTMITEAGEILINEYPKHSGETGCFGLIERNGNIVRIKQDYTASFGLFLYQNHDQFLVSNSFYALAEILGETLSLNRDYMYSLIYARECPIDLHGTLANEIYRLSSDEILEIDCSTKTLSIQKLQRSYFSIKPDTKQALELLDQWYLKWVNLFHTLAQNRQPLFADLTGGLDTRIILSMLMHAGIDLNTAVRMTTHDYVNLPKDAADNRIANEIARTFGFKLNSDLVTCRKQAELKPDDTYQLMRSYSLGQTLYCRLLNFYNHQPVFFAKGLGSIVKGSVAIHGKAWNDPEEMISEYESVVERLIKSQHGLTKEEKESFIEESRNRIVKHVQEIPLNPELSPEHAATYLYQRTFIEGRDAKKVLQLNLRSQIVVSPFLDPLINTFDYDPDNSDPLFLSTLILSRYQPELLAFDIEGRTFSDHSLKKAAEINQRYPAHLPVFEPVSGSPMEIDTDTCEPEEITGYLRALLNSDEVSKLVKPVVGSDLYNAVNEEWDVSLHERRPFRPFTLLALYEFLRLRKSKEG